MWFGPNKTENSLGSLVPPSNETDCRRVFEAGTEARKCRRTFSLSSRRPPRSGASAAAGAAMAGAADALAAGTFPSVVAHSRRKSRAHAPPPRPPPALAPNAIRLNTNAYIRRWDRRICCRCSRSRLAAVGEVLHDYSGHVCQILRPRRTTSARR